MNLRARAGLMKIQLEYITTGNCQERFGTLAHMTNFVNQDKQFRPCMQHRFSRLFFDFSKYLIVTSFTFYPNPVRFSNRSTTKQIMYTKYNLQKIYITNQIFQLSACYLSTKKCAKFNCSLTQCHCEVKI